MALGAAISVLAVATRMIYLLPVMGFMFLVSTISVILQVGSFRLTGTSAYFVWRRCTIILS